MRVSCKGQGRERQETDGRQKAECVGERGEGREARKQIGEFRQSSLCNYFSIGIPDFTNAQLRVIHFQVQGA